MALSPKDLFMHIYNETIDELDEICRETLKVTGKDREIFQFTDIGGIEPHLSPQVHSRTQKVTQIHLPHAKQILPLAQTRLLLQNYHPRNERRRNRLRQRNIFSNFGLSNFPKCSRPHSSTCWDLPPMSLQMPADAQRCQWKEVFKQPKGFESSASVLNS